MGLLLDSQNFGGGFQNHTVDALFRHRDFKEADIFAEGFPILGLLLLDQRKGVLPSGSGSQWSSN